MGLPVFVALFAGGSTDLRGGREEFIFLAKRPCDCHTEPGRRLLCGEHAKRYLGFVGTKNERPHWRENNIGGGFQHRIDGVAGWSFVIVDGHNIISRRESWNRKLEYLVFDPDKFFSGNFFSVGIGSQEFKFRPVHHPSTYLNSRPAH